MTPEERQRFVEADDEGNLLDCAEQGGAGWDWGPDYGRDEARSPERALRSAINDLNEDEPCNSRYLLPTSGWIGLREDETSIQFIHIDEHQRWRWHVSVSSDPQQLYWREHTATTCGVAGS